MENELSRAEVLKIARLARLELTEAEVTEYQKKLGRVVGYVKELDALSPDVKGFPQHVPTDSVALREDRATVYPGREELIQNAPDVKEHCFSLPAIMDET